MQGIKFKAATLVARKFVLDYDGMTWEFVSFEHPSIRHFLCLAPPHLLKAWKRQIAKLKLNSVKSDSVFRLILGFAFDSTLRTNSELDLRWECITRMVMSICEVKVIDEKLVKLPPDMKLDNLYDGIEAVGPVETFSPDAVSQLGDLPAIKKLSQAVQLDVSDELEEEDLSSGSSSQAVGEHVAGVMRYIYQTAPLWCQSIAQQGYTMNCKTSSWAEAEGGAARRAVCREVLRHSRTVDNIIPAIVTWAGEQIYKTADSLSKVPHNRGCLTESQVMELRRYLYPYAVENIIKHTLEAQQTLNFLDPKLTVPRKNVPPAVLGRVGIIAKYYQITEEEVVYYMGKRVARRSDSDGEDVDLLESCANGAASCDPPLIAIYHPSQGISKIPFFDDKEGL